MITDVSSLSTKIINNLLNTKSYFARPYCSNNKGTVENINGLIRRFFSKGTNFAKISKEEIAYVEDWINNREFKVLNWLTPNQVYENLLKSVALLIRFFASAFVKFCKFFKENPKVF